MKLRNEASVLRQAMIIMGQSRLQNHLSHSIIIITGISRINNFTKVRKRKMEVCKIDDLLNQDQESMKQKSYQERFEEYYKEYLEEETNDTSMLITL